MNTGTKIRTVLRVLVSIYSAICVWQVAINEIGNMLGIKWVAIICTIAIVIFGFAVDVISHWCNNDYTEEACKGTGYTRQLKEEQKLDYVGERFYTDDFGNLIEAGGEEVDDES